MLSEFLSKGTERSIYWNEYKTKSENKNTADEYKYFLESNFVAVKRLFVLVYSNQDDNSKRFKAKAYYLPKGIIDNYNVIINGKNFYDQAIDSGIKRYEEIRKVTTGQGEDYATGWVEHKIPDHAKYITTPEFNKLTEERFTARLKQADLVNKTNFDDKLTRFNERFTSNKTKHLEVQKKLNSLITKDIVFSFVEFILLVMMDLKTRFFISQHLIL